MLDNIVYFSGVHGSGKSTLVREIAKRNGFIEHKRIHSVTLNDTYIRAVWRLTKYYIEATEQTVLAQAETDKIILGNRCVYDNFAYMNAFQKLAWVSDEEIKHHSKVFETLFCDTLRPKAIVHIAPSLDWVKDRLAERWKKDGKKWREDNFEYLEAVMHAYNEIYRNLPIKILRLDETDYTKRIDVVLNWLSKLREN